MKRLITILIVLTAAVGTMSAQKTYTSKQGYEIPANEFSFSYGRVSLPTFAYTLGGALGSAFTGGLARMSTAVSTGSFGLEYEHYVHPNVALGGLFTYEDYLLGFDTAKGKDADGNRIYEEGQVQNHHVFSIMPSAKFNWFSYEHVSMYSKLAVGMAVYYTPEVNYTCVDDDGNVQEKTIEGSRSVSYAFQVNPVGVDFGNRNLRGFAELGWGCQGLWIIGLRYCF